MKEGVVITLFPQHIKDAIIVAARYHEKATEKQKVVENWIEDRFGEAAINHDGIRDALIDCVEQSNNPISALKQIESILEDEF